MINRYDWHCLTAVQQKKLMQRPVLKQTGVEETVHAIIDAVKKRRRPRIISIDTSL